MDGLAFSFLHTGDWQIGRTFARFPGDVGGALRDARLDAIDRIGGAADRAGVRHVLVAGDIYETDAVAERTLRQPLEIMQRYRGLVWHLLAGNHDPARTGGVWQRVTAIGAPENVRLYLTPGTHELAAGVALLVAPLKNKITSSDPTVWMDEAATGDGVIRIGLAHGATERFGSEGTAAVPISGRRAERAGLDYMALGDDHGTKRVNERTWYAGTPEPDGWKDNDPGNALIVRLDGPGAVPAVEKVATATFRWLERDLEISGPGVLAELDALIAAQKARPRDILLRVGLRGTVAPFALSEINAALQRLSARLRHLECSREALLAGAGDGDLERLAGAGELSKVAARLARICDEADGPDRAAAGRALALLFAYAGREDAT